MFHRRQVLQGAAVLAAPAVLSHARAASRVRVGVSLPLTSVQAAVATDIQVGLQLAFARAAERGLEIVPEWYDDRSDPDLTAKGIAMFAADPGFTAVTSIVGTPHAIKALPVASQAGLPVVGLRSGANELRDGRPGVFHLRASYGDELDRMVSLVAGAGLGQIAVVFSEDAFGRGAMAQVKAIAAARKVEIASALPAERNGSNVQQTVTAAINTPGKPPRALLMLMIAEPMEKGVRHARLALDFVHPIFCMSFCATRLLAESKESYLRGLALTSAFQVPRVDTSPLAADFLRLAGKFAPGSEVSLTSYEAFVYGSTLQVALARAKDPSRKALREALRAPLDVGGYEVAFDALNVGRHYLGVLHKSFNGLLRA